MFTTLHRTNPLEIYDDADLQSKFIFRWMRFLAITDKIIRDAIENHIIRQGSPPGTTELRLAM